MPKYVNWGAESRLSISPGRTKGNRAGGGFSRHGPGSVIVFQPHRSDVMLRFIPYEAVTLRRGRLHRRTRASRGFQLIVPRLLCSATRRAPRHPHHDDEAPVQQRYPRNNRSEIEAERARRRCRLTEVGPQRRHARADSLYSPDCREADFSVTQVTSRATFAQPKLPSP